MPNSNRGIPAVATARSRSSRNRSCGPTAARPRSCSTSPGSSPPSWPPPSPPADGTPSSPCSPAWSAGTSSALPPGVIVAAWPVIRAIWWWAPETILCRQPGLRLDRARRPHHPAHPARGHRRHRRRPRRSQAGPHPPAPGQLVPGHPAPHPDLLLRIHHHQPHRQPAADLVGTPHPRRGTRVDLAAPRPVHR